MMTDPPKSIHQPIHPSIRDKLEPEYVAFHDENLQYVEPSESKPWHPDQRLAASPMALGAMKVVEVGSTRDYDQGKYQLRVFTPDGTPPEGGWPLLVWCHGGGWVVGGLNSENGFLTHICKYTSTVVISVNYRHAPEYTYPTAINDVVEALQYIVSKSGTDLFRTNSSRLAIGGLSAGGCLTAILSLKASQLNPPITPRFQLMILPVIDSTATTSTIWSTSQHAPWLTPSRMTWYREKYFPNHANTADASNWDASPNYAPKGLLAKSPRTFLAIADCDLLAPEGLAYAESLKDAGVDVEAKSYQGGTHSLLILAGILPKGKQLVDDACDALASALGTEYTYKLSAEK